MNIICVYTPQTLRAGHYVLPNIFYIPQKDKAKQIVLVLFVHWVLANLYRV